MESKEKQQIIIISDIIKFWNFIEDIRNDVRITKNKEILVKGTIIAIYVPRKKEENIFTMIRNKYDMIIGIDPDVDKSGVAELILKKRLLEAKTLAFPELLDYLQARKKMAEKGNYSLIVVIEASWLISHNWHKGNMDNYRTAAAKGNSAGRNHEVGRKIVEMCRHYGIEVIEQRPLKKCWKGPGGKITHKELACFTGLMGKTNQEMRDAALLAWNYAGLPIRIRDCR